MSASLAYAPLLAPLAAAIAALALDAFSRRRAAVWVAVALLAGGAAAAAWTSLPRSESGSLTAFGGVFLAGAWASAAPAVMLALSALALAGGSRRAVVSDAGSQVVALTCISASAAVAAVTSTDLAMTVIALETMALCAYGLVGAAHTDGSREASMKYLVQGAIATCLAITSLAVAFWPDGSFSYGSLLHAASGDLDTLPALAALLVAVLAFKSGAFPFHSWAPDAYSASDAPQAAFLATVPKAAALIVGGVLLSAVIGGSRFVWLAVAVAVGSIVVGNLAGLRQTSYRRMLAYSGVAHAGYAMSALVSDTGHGAILVYACTYAVAALGAFMFEEALLETEPSYDGSIAALSGVARRRPGLALALAACLFSLTGIPLTAGFWGKFVLFVTVLGTEGGGWWWLAVIGVIGSVVSFGYYGSVLRTAYFDDSSGAVGGGGRPGAATVAVIVCAIIVVIIGLAPLLTGISPLLFALGLS